MDVLRLKQPVERTKLSRAMLYVLMATEPVRSASLREAMLVNRKTLSPAGGSWISSGLRGKLSDRAWGREPHYAMAKSWR